MRPAPGSPSRSPALRLSVSVAFALAAVTSGCSTSVLSSRQPEPSTPSEPATLSAPTTPPEPAAADSFRQRTDADFALRSIVEGDGDGPPLAIDDPRARERHLAERFPGVRSIDLVRVVVEKSPRRGTCWSEVMPVDQAPVRVVVGNAGESPVTFDRFADLEAAGWNRVYRVPETEGIEARTSFASLELDLDQELYCLCQTRTGVDSVGPIPLRMTLRWAEGEMPRVGATTTKDGRPRSLPLTFEAGSLVLYRASLETPLPGERFGSCGAEITATLLVDPPIL